jgi:hypothetical protein
MSLKKIICILACLPLILSLSACFGGGGGGGGGNTESRSASGGFLWKPRSESTGNLVVLFPREFRGQHAGAAVHSEDPPNEGNKIEQGIFHTESHNGNRVHYRFNRPGSGFGQNIYAVITLQDGRRISYFVPNGASRAE